EPQPEPQPGSATISSFGPAITMKLPESVRKEIKDQGMAITRMHVYFDEEKSNEGAVVEYEGMRTEVPVIYAAFKGDECDKELSYPEWLSRGGRYVDLAFEVKTKPGVLDGMGVKIVHSHLQGEVETELSTYDITVPEDGEPWDTLRLRGAQPGINRYTIFVSYTDSTGETTTQKGFSHWVVVQAPPMFEFANTVTATATRSDLGKNTSLEGDVHMDASFLLHHGLDPKDCTLRITRKGKRELNLSSLPPEVRRVITKEKIPPGWQEVAKIDFDAEQDVVSVEESFIKVRFDHAFAASAAVLPATEQWEYQFELQHKDSASPLARWSVKVDLSVAKESDIRNATLKVNATGLDKALEVKFKAK
ncbi:MAG: hypothetical protein KDB29_05370, partial [Planctomycetes bacterium]|nr:hypothetical protein [Planctomycetota bacterium]